MIDRRQVIYRNHTIVTSAAGGREGPFKAHLQVEIPGAPVPKPAHSENLPGSFPDIEAAHAAAGQQARRYVDRQA